MDWEGIYQIFHLSKEGEIWRLSGPFQTLSKSMGKTHQVVQKLEFSRRKIAVVQAYNNIYIKHVIDTQEMQREC